MSRGGNRHNVKPQVDEGLLLKLFHQQSELIKDLGAYEKISKTQAINPKRLMTVLPLTKGLLQLENTGEIHGQCLRKALFQLLLEDPSLNDSKFSGGVWVGLKVERLGVLLCHMRKLANSNLQQCAAKLSGSELLQLKDVVEMMKKKDTLDQRVGGADEQEEEKKMTMKCQKENCRRSSA